MKTKKYKYLFILLLFTLKGFGQRDLIITTPGENIRCQILKETSTAFEYAYITPTQTVTKSLIFKSLIKSFKYNEFDNDLPPMQKSKYKYVVVIPKKTSKKSDFETTKIKPTEVLLKQDTSISKIEKVLNDSIPGRDPKFDFNNFLKYRAGFKFGGGYMPFESTPRTPYGYYRDKLKIGIVFGMDVLCFGNNHLGYGLTYSSFSSQNSSSKIDFPNDYTNKVEIGGKLSNKISVKFLAPTIGYRKQLNARTSIVATFSPGVLLYKDKGAMNLGSFTKTGSTFGTSSNISLDRMLGNDVIGRDIILCFEAGFVTGTFKSLNKGETLGVQKLATPINAMRVDFAIGLRFTRFPYNFR